MKKFINQYIIIGIAALSLSLGMTSCKDYLDKAPESTVGEEEAFKNFTNFQGFVEEVYNCIPNKESCYWCVTFNWGEDEICNTGIGDTHLTAHFDLGDYRWWYNNEDKGGNQSWLHCGSGDRTLSPTATGGGVGGAYQHSLEHAWYCIRKMNLGLENLDKMVDATQEEKNLIKGQMLFFRAWWHHQLIEWYGGMPYVDYVLPSDEVLALPRLSFKECALKCAEDYRAAADLLPNNWDETTAGQRTAGQNELRITKVCALGYMGKVLLWAASPLNVLGAQTGALRNGNTYKYDTDLAKRAADVLAEAISYVENGETPYALAEFNYSNIYDHTPADGAETCFSEIFYTTGQGWKQPGTVEAIMRGTPSGANLTPWNFAKTWGPKVNELVPHDAFIHMPTANYVNYAYGMANGEPIVLADGSLNPKSGFDPTHPYKNRDPRFYHDIMFDGFKFLNGTPAASDVQYQYLEMFHGGNMVPSGVTAREADGSRTGYFCQKLIPHQCNKVDQLMEYGNEFEGYLPYMRLADIYLLYAESAAASGNLSKAANAINVLRDRVGAGHVASRFASDQKLLIDEIRRERACELAFEGFRWQDLQRWLLLTEYPYNIKTRQDFYRADPNYDYAKKDPRDAEVTGWKEELILTRQLGVKHYLLPLKESDIYLNDQYPQNPGW
ncbi:MAG: RagB/SusD family nutrient uptake outer membrane protein [Prevotella sp.]|nr:RagB/SusD family nutrient uptake outer membrane protein [Prevotella sp.]